MTPDIASAGLSPSAFQDRWRGALRRFFRSRPVGHDAITPGLMGGILLLAGVQFAVGILTVELFRISANFSEAVWAPAGVAIAALLLFGRRLWPGLLLGSLLLYATVLAPKWGFVPVLTLTAADVIMGVAGAHLVQRFANGPRAFERASDTFKFIGVGVFVALLPAAGLMAGFFGAPLQPLLWAGALWWMSVAAGVVVVAPVVVLWVRNPRPRWTRTQAVEGGIILAATGAIAAFVFAGPCGFVGICAFPPGSPPRLSYLAFPLLVWIAFRFQQREAATVVLLLSTAAFWGAIHGVGPFVAPASSLPLLQTYIGVMTLVAVPLAAVVADSRRAEKRLRRSHAKLEGRVRERTASLSEAVAAAEREASERRRAEAHLRVSEARLSEAQGLARLGSWAWDPSSNRITLSRDLTASLGLPSDPGGILSFDDFFAHLHPSDRPRVCNRFAEAYEKSRSFAFDDRVRPLNGSPRWLHWRGEVVATVEGKPARMHGTIQDITERKIAEEKFRTLLESAPDAMVIVDGYGRIVLVNEQTERLFGYPRDQLLGEPVEILMPDRFRGRHEAHRGSYSTNPRPRGMGEGLELYGQRANGEEFPIEISLSPLETEEGVLVSSAIRDVTERKMAEARIRNALREKESLLKEIHHRVKNNLQVVSSLLAIQSYDVLDGSAKSLLRENRQRIRSMALVHEKLYEAKDLSRVDFGSYVKDLAEQLFISYGQEDGRVSLRLQLPSLHLDADSTVNLGLILNELVANSLKHAFPDGRKGEVAITLGVEKNGREAVLTVRDDGIGFPEGMDPREASSMGLELVHALAGQLDATVHIAGDDGTEVRVRFPLDPSREGD